MTILTVRARLANRLRLFRVTRGWTQEALAEASGLHRTYISSLERGGRNISIDNIDRLAQALGISISELIDPIDPSTIHVPESRNPRGEE